MSTYTEEEWREKGKNLGESKDRRERESDGRGGGELIIVCLTEGERERSGRVANSVCDVGIDQSHRQKGGT